MVQFSHLVIFQSCWARLCLSPTVGKLPGTGPAPSVVLVSTVESKTMKETELNMVLGRARALGQAAAEKTAKAGRRGAMEEFVRADHRV